MAVAANVLVVIEATGERVPAAAYELLAAASHVAAKCAGRVVAMLVGAAGDTIADTLIARGAERVYAVPMADLANRVVEARLPAILGLCRQLEPRLVLLAHDVAGAELAPRLAFRLDGAVATGCVGIDAGGDGIRCTRPCYGGVAREVDRFETAPVIVTMRAGVFEPAPQTAGRHGEIIRMDSRDEIISRTRLIARELDRAEGARLEDAAIIVAGGRGLQGPEGFRLLEALASELGGAVGASRVPCDLGWCPHSWQIGLTGKTVTPELYIAVGISGAGHHMAGCGNAKTIVAINTDPQAAIFQDARLGVVGDFRAVVPALAAELRKLKQAG